MPGLPHHDGQGQPQSAPLAGLPAAYIVRQLSDMVKGDRKTYRADMAMFAKILTPEEMKQLADYYSSLHFTPVDRGEGNRHGAEGGGRRA